MKRYNASKNSLLHMEYPREDSEFDRAANLYRFDRFALPLALALSLSTLLLTPLSTPLIHVITAGARQKLVAAFAVIAFDILMKIVPVVVMISLFIRKYFRSR